MFDFAWTEIALIAVVALIAIGPKDLPVAIKAVTQMIKKARRMAGEFQTHVDDLVREANLDEVRNQIKDIRNFDFKGEVERAVDPDNSLRATFASNPLSTTPTSTHHPPALPSEAAVGEYDQTVIDAPAEMAVLTPPTPVKETACEAVPAWLPPAMAPKAATAAEPAVADAPAYIPPAFAKRRPTA